MNVVSKIAVALVKAILLMKLSLIQTYTLIIYQCRILYFIFAVLRHIVPKKID